MRLLKSGRADPYNACPVYEGSRFRLRLIAEDDAEALLPCYRTPTAAVTANAEGCSFGYGAQTVEAQRDVIRGWLDAYAAREFVRLSIIDKAADKPVGTVELCGACKDGRLRIDLPAVYERADCLAELLGTADAFFADFGCARLLVRSMDETVLRAAGYTPCPQTNGFWEKAHPAPARERNPIKEKNGTAAWAVPSYYRKASEKKPNASNAMSLRRTVEFSLLLPRPCPFGKRFSLCRERRPSPRRLLKKGGGARGG